MNPIKRVYIMRGIPGSGKSSFVAKISKDLDSQAPVEINVVSADHYFEKCKNNCNAKVCDHEKEYKFDATKLGEAHRQCQDRFLRLVESEHSMFIFVDNTNTTRKELDFYVNACYIYKVKQWTIVNVICDVEKAAARNTHGVPPEKVRQMYKRFMEAMLPIDWPQQDYYSE